MNEQEFAALKSADDALQSAFSRLAPVDWDVDWKGVEGVLGELAGRLADNLPYHHPLYAGQMLKPPHPAARLAYTLAMQLNPNNHALDGGKATSAMEKECIDEIASMFGWKRALGHLSSGGTFANFEALWIARELHPGKAVAASAQAHYTHERLSAVLEVPFQSLPVDAFGRIDLDGLETALNAGRIGTVVATLGTTGLGAVDPLADIADLCLRFGVRLHVDAAYGGYFTLADNLRPQTRRAFDHVHRADSIVVDPHKHGLQPYGCGCVLFRDPTVGRYYRHDSPYTYFTSNDLHLGEISLECSRPGASAAALWTTMRLLPLVRGGAFAKSLEACRTAACELHRRLESDSRFTPVVEPKLDIVVWIANAVSAGDASSKAEAVFQAAAKRDLHLAKIRLPRSLVEGLAPNLAWDQETVVCLRSCLMKPNHIEWLDEIWSRLSAAADES